MTDQQQSEIRDVAIYARVSTDKQDNANQLLAVNSYVEDRGWATYEVYTDTISSRKDKRPGLADLEDAARAGRFDAVVFYSMSRWCRSVSDLLVRAEVLRKAGVPFVSVTEPFIDTSTAAGTFVFHVLAAVNQLERDLTSERTKLSLARIKAGDGLGQPKPHPKTGKVERRPIGRPRRLKVDTAGVHHLRNAGFSITAIADELKMSRRTVGRVLKGEYSDSRG